MESHHVTGQIEHQWRVIILVSTYCIVLSNVSTVLYRVMITQSEDRGAIEEFLVSPCSIVLYWTTFTLALAFLLSPLPQDARGHLEQIWGHRFDIQEQVLKTGE